jgi:hypothetical protein
MNICLSLQKKKKHISTLSSFFGSYPFAVSNCLHHGASVGTPLFKQASAFAKRDEASAMQHNTASLIPADRPNTRPPRDMTQPAN